MAYRWSGRTSLSARMRYGSNFPIQGYISEVPNGYMLSEQRNGARLPDYSRLDLRADRTFTYRKSRLTLFMEVVNVMNNENFRPNTPFFNLATRRAFEPTEKLVPAAAGRRNPDRVLIHPRKHRITEPQKALLEMHLRKISPCFCASVFRCDAFVQQGWFTCRDHRPGT